jgi:predicted SprT family Zn-dependent metalloprotease
VIAISALLLERDRAFAAVTTALGVVAWPEVPVRWNRRLRRAGRAVIERRRGEVARATIELSPSYFEVYPADLHGILIHEAVHVGLALLGLPFGHSPTFRAACERAGGRQHSRDMPGRVYRYRCPVCLDTLDRRRRPGGDRWCARCARDAERAGTPPFVAARALLLVGVAFQGPEMRARPASDAGPVADSEARELPTAPSIDNPSAPWCRS